jgi:hypothetical protein
MRMMGLEGLYEMREVGWQDKDEGDEMRSGQ